LAAKGDARSEYHIHYTDENHVRIKAVIDQLQARFGAAVMAGMQEMPTDDPIFGKGSIRVDGAASTTSPYSRSRRRKKSRQPYDYYKLLSTVPGDKAYHPLSASECSQVNVAND